MSSIYFVVHSSKHDIDQVLISKPLLMFQAVVLEITSIPSFALPVISIGEPF